MVVTPYLLCRYCYCTNTSILPYYQYCYSTKTTLIQYNLVRYYYTNEMLPGEKIPAHGGKKKPTSKALTPRGLYPFVFRLKLSPPLTRGTVRPCEAKNV